MSRTPYSLSVVSGGQGLAGIRDAWRQLEGGLRRPHFFHLAEFYEAYAAAHAGRDDDVQFALLHEGADLRAVFPFKRSVQRLGGLPLRVLEFPAPWDLGADILSRQDGTESQVVGALFRALSAAVSGWDVVFLARVLQDSCAAALLREPPRGMRVTAERAGGVFYVQLAPYEQMLQRFSHGFRRNLSKQKNHLMRFDSVEFVCADSGAALDEALQAFMDLEAAGWKGRLGTAILKLSPEVAVFYRELVRRFGARQACEIYLLKAEGKVIAAQVCYLCGGTCYMVKVAYDGNYPKCSPGQSLIQHILERCGERPALTTTNFCSDEAWMNDLKPSTDEVYAVRVFNRTPGGAAARLLLGLKAWVRRRRLRKTSPSSRPLPPPAPEA